MRYINIRKLIIRIEFFRLFEKYEQFYDTAVHDLKIRNFSNFSNILKAFCFERIKAMMINKLFSNKAYE